MKVVISIGGSLLTRELTAENFRKYVDVFKRLADDKHELVIVSGGGKVCREYRDVARGLGADNEMMDWVGIMATHLNASTLIAGLKAAGVDVYWIKLKPEEMAFEEVQHFFGKRVIVAAGYAPGHSTDYDSALFARAVKADLLINASNIDGVYTADPKKDPGAKRIGKMSYDEFIGILEKNEQAPGEYRLFDLAAAHIIKEDSIRTIMIDGKDPNEILAAVEGKHGGTTIGKTERAE